MQRMKLEGLEKGVAQQAPLGCTTDSTRIGRGENGDNTLSALKMAVWSMEAPEGWSTAALEKRTAHSPRLCQGMGRGMSL
ncbi:unnamed protein product [Rangifer tarandus platyrhynchus]|uniref:Uncharacterized protein n=1 Tax=Rangifer tarandus platyrhynchus TaxID=3082113 RepID=A0AC59YM67_RANTA